MFLEEHYKLFFPNPKRCNWSVYWSVLGLYVTVHLEIPDSRLQYFVHLPVSMNPSKGIYRGIGAAVINRCFIYYYTLIY
jgi:hypothetical protein